MSDLAKQDPEASARFFSESFQNIKDEIGKVIIGQADVVDQLLISLFSRGHCVLVGVPGLAKTLLIQTLAETLNLSFSRIQFTPDLMPGDITGTEVIEDNKETGKKHFKFIKGLSLPTLYWPMRSTERPLKHRRHCWKECRSIT